METFGERVKESRKKLGLTQKQLSKLSGMAQATLSDIERGKNEGSRDVVSLANALKVSAEWLINGAGDTTCCTDTDKVVSEFALVYENATEGGRAMLRDAIQAAHKIYVKSA